MLEKLLPSIFKKKSELNQNQKNPQPQNLQNESKGESSLESDFNLISKSQNLYIVPKFATDLSILIRKFIVGLSVTFGVLLILNFTISFMVDYQKRWQDRLVGEIDTYADVEERAKHISDKTLAYKKFLNNRVLMSDKIDFVFDNLRSGIELSNLQVNPSSFSISVAGGSALDFTNLILRYLEGDTVAEIIIESASLDKNESQYKVMLRGNFK